MKSGFKSTGFYLSLAAILVGHTLSSQVITDERITQLLGFITQALGSAGYAWTRSDLKIEAIDGSPLKPGWKSTEFWGSLVSALLSVATGAGAGELVTRVLSLVQMNIDGIAYLLTRNRVTKAHIIDAKARKEMEATSIRTVLQ